MDNIYLTGKEKRAKL